jgi:tRNA threonylcarbamoyladenosine biosynthesis protein TsaB
MAYLGLDTATSRGSVALVRDARIVATELLGERAWHARELFPAIERLLGGAGLTPAELRGVGVAIGPGSFTGLRIGMATAKGLGYALRIGVTGLSTLEALARAAARAAPPPGVVCAVLEAGRGEVYAAMFRLEGDAMSRLGADRSYRPGDLLRELSGGTRLAGDGAALMQEVAAAAGRRFDIVDPTPPLAPVLALHAAATIRPDAGYEPGRLRPNYIRPSDAEAARRQS